MPDRRVISNTSPLLYLHQIGYLDLLQRLYGRVWTSPGVAAELSIGGQSGYDVPIVEEIPWLDVVGPTEQPQLLPALLDLDQGEAEIIALAVQWPGSLVLLDERLARRLASHFGLRVTGTIGVLIKAKEKGLLELVRPALKALKATSMWLGDDLVELALRKAGEME